MIKEQLLNFVFLIGLTITSFGTVYLFSKVLLKSEKKKKKHKGNKWITYSLIWECETMERYFISNRGRGILEKMNGMIKLKVSYPQEKGNAQNKKDEFFDKLKELVEEYYGFHPAPSNRTGKIHS